LLLFAFLGALQAFNMSEFRFLNPVTSGETLAFVGLIVLVFLLLMLLLSLLLLNRSIDRWFSQPTSELREDSTRVILELAQYATANARVEAESIAASGAADKPIADLDAELDSHRITLEGGFAVVFDKDRKMLAGFQDPPVSSTASLETWQ